MKLCEILTPSFKSIGEELGLKVETFGGRLITWAPRWRQALSVESEFCKALVSCGYLTERQMLRAALRYRLGATKTGGVIYWQIDNHEETYEGKIMHYLPNCHRNKARNADWVGSALARRYGWGKGTARHCFFGLHQLSKSRFGYTNAVKQIDERYVPLCASTGSATAAPEHVALELCSLATAGTQEGPKGIAIVEAEKTAVILSEIYPQYIWLAAGGLTQLQIDKFRPLRGRNLILFPDTDPTGEAYKLWYETAHTVQQQLFWEDSPPIHVSDLLERQASKDQKQRKIDLVDYYFETIKPSLSSQK